MSARFGLSAGELTRLRTILETALDRIERVAVFGSRAEGRHRPHSDLDLVLYGTADEAVCDRLWTLFQDSPLPFSVDVKHYDGIAYPPLRAHIDAALTDAPSPALPDPKDMSPGPHTALVTGAPAVVFVCSPLGSQWRGMARQLLASEPVFRAALGRCDRAFRPRLGRSIRDDLAGDWQAEDDVIRAQPLLFAVQVGLAALLRSWGVAPAAVLGHSAGEIAAAHIAGLLDLEQAAEVVAGEGVEAAGVDAMREAALPQGVQAAGVHDHRGVGGVLEPHPQEILVEAAGDVGAEVAEQDAARCFFLQILLGADEAIAIADAAVRKREARHHPIAVKGMAVAHAAALHAPRTVTIKHAAQVRRHRSLYKLQRRIHFLRDGLASA